MSAVLLQFHLMAAETAVSDRIKISPDWIEEPCGSHMYQITYVESIADDLKRLQARQRQQILDRIDEQLTYEPTRPTRNKKILVGLAPPWEYMEPVWELRVGEYRVFYDVDETTSVIIVRAIRHKPPHKTIEEIL